jgi:peptide subunit release factor 1 (eRF1)
MITARRVLKEGRERFFAADLEQARKLFYDGLSKLETLIVRYPNLTDEEVVESTLVDDVLKSILMWQYVLHLNGEEVPEEFPLKDIWDRNADKRAELDAAFQAKMGMSGD